MVRQAFWACKCKFFQIQRFFLQAIARIPLAVLWNFKDLQVRQSPFHFLQIFMGPLERRRLRLRAGPGREMDRARPMAAYREKTQPSPYHVFCEIENKIWFCPWWRGDHGPSFQADRDLPAFNGGALARPMRCAFRLLILGKRLRRAGQML